MTFALPQLLWLLVLPAALLAWELVRGRRLAGISHPKILRAEAGLRTVSLAAAGDPALPAGRRRFLLCAGLALARSGAGSTSPSTTSPARSSSPWTSPVRC
jgi:Ca-activated chloride channel family protein